MSELSTRLRLRRKELGLSQEELAQRMGYRSKSSITKLERASTTCRRPSSRSLLPRWRPLPPTCWGWMRPVRRRVLSRCLPWCGSR